MTYVASVAFVGVLAGEEVQFFAGDIIGDADALEMNLANKPDIAEPTA